MSFSWGQVISGSCHTANKGSLIWQSRLNIQRPTSAFPELISFLTYTKFLLRAPQLYALFHLHVHTVARMLIFPALFSSNFACFSRSSLKSLSSLKFPLFIAARSKCFLPWTHKEPGNTVITLLQLHLSSPLLDWIKILLEKGCMSSTSKTTINCTYVPVTI